MPQHTHRHGRARWDLTKSGENVTRSTGTDSMKYIYFMLSVPVPGRVAYFARLVEGLRALRGSERVSATRGATLSVTPPLLRSQPPTTVRPPACGHGAWGFGWAKAIGTTSLAFFPTRPRADVARSAGVLCPFGAGTRMRVLIPRVSSFDTLPRTFVRPSPSAGTGASQGLHPLATLLRPARAKLWVHACAHSGGKERSVSFTSRAPSGRRGALVAQDTRQFEMP